MKILLTLFAFVLSASAMAKTYKIENIDRGRRHGEKDLIFLSDGRVGTLQDSKSSEALTASEALRKDLPVKVTLDNNFNVIEIKVSEEEDKNFSAETSVAPRNDYIPTVLPDLASVNTIFNRMNRRWQRDSQCYNRAHVWNYEEFQRTGLLSKKVFIFYTRRYIRDYRFKWWFHAIPTVLAQHEGTIVERYLDPMFARTPLKQKSWTDIFIRSRRSCPVITKYSQYRDNQESEHCYLHFSSMYYWQPRDLDNYERTGFEKMNFIRSEVNWAYWEAF
jgi:hypothetical protein